MLPCYRFNQEIDDLSVNCLNVLLKNLKTNRGLRDKYFREKIVLVNKHLSFNKPYFTLAGATEINYSLIPDMLTTIISTSIFHFQANRNAPPKL